MKLFATAIRDASGRYKMVGIIGDPRILTLADEAHSESEERWFSIGLANNGSPVSVAYSLDGIGTGPHQD